MFQKRQKKNFPPGTFIPTPARVMAITQLCFAFSLFLWIVSQPFMGDLYTIRSQLIDYETVMGSHALADATLMQRNAERFAALPESQKEALQKQYAALKAEMQTTFWQKLLRSLELLAVKTAPLELAWLFFSVLIPILLLKRVEGSVPAVWLLVIVTLVYAVDNRLNGYSIPNRAVQLYPTEERLLEKYIKAPLKPGLSEQQQQLVQGWKLYLIDEWAKESAAIDPGVFNQQVEKGEFAFNVAHINALEPLGKVLSVNAPVRRLSLGILGLYLFWNVLFAVVVMRNCKKE